MRFAKRQVQSILIKRGQEVIYAASTEGGKKILTIFAHEDEETNSQLLGIVHVDTATGEVCTQRINLPITDMYLVSIIEILAIEV